MSATRSNLTYSLWVTPHGIVFLTPIILHWLRRLCSQLTLSSSSLQGIVYDSITLLSVDFVFLLLARHSLCQHNSALAAFVGSADIE